MEQSLEGRIRERAFEIWSDQGRPEGCAEEYWLMAEREILTVPVVTSPPSRAKTSRKPKNRAVR